ncbi:uncharacterized protein EV154DRAFT_487059 [Mucor mucedo]|uniref:uncharacterized protein n=1 Tax=Mucor mucedo TaxID=29922 RepID=UPI00221E9C28|nr:uncharacterized protein EV154DRAFT_487059 [Mucor mucedo]KAI7873856.1 hypothetical protein EV154DRAFT_487059 [Mucor mucedo]
MEQQKKLSKLLSNFLRVLLRIHLAPKREARSQNLPFDRIGIINKNRNGKRALFKNEERRLKKYARKAEVDKINGHKWIRKSESCQFRINTYKNRREDTKKDAREELEAPDVELEIMADSNISAEKRLIEIEDGNINDDETADTSRRQIKSLVAVVRNVMFKNFGKTINEKHIRAICCTDIQPNELETCTLIVNFIMPYIPEKKNWRVLPYQLPMVLKTNEIFH